MNSGFLHIISGSMFSGKTTALLTLYNQFKPSVLIFNHSYDNRYDSNNKYITTHDKNRIPCTCIHTINDIYNHPDFLTTKVIMIDEIQFFTRIKTDILQLVEFYNKHVVLSGLMIDIQRNIFGELSELVPFADRFEQKLSTCSICKNKGLFSLRKNNKNTNIVDVGSSDKYYAVCRYHYLNKNQYI